MRGGGSGSRRAPGRTLWGLGSRRRGAEAATGKAGSFALQVPSNSEGRTGRAGAAACGDVADPGSRAGIGVGGRAAARGSDHSRPGSRLRASGCSPGPFPNLRTRLPETLGLPELPRCFSSSGLHVRVPWDPVRKFGGILTNSTVTDAEAEER